MAPGTHLILDYLTGTVLVVVALATGLNGSAPGTVLLILGLGQLALAAATRWKLTQLAPPVTPRMHAGLDTAVGAVALALAAVMLLNNEGSGWYVVGAVGILMLGAVLATRWSAEPRGTGTRVETVHDGSDLVGGRYAGETGGEESGGHDDAESPREWPDPARPDEAGHDARPASRDTA